MRFLNSELTTPKYYPRNSAWLGHGPFALWLVSQMKPKVIVELGSHQGYSYFAMCQAVREQNLPTRTFAVDTWQGDEHAGFYDDTIYKTVQRKNEEYKDFSTLLRMTFAEAVDKFEDNSVDLLHVDGRHFYDDVKEDFLTWAPKLSKSAVVLFHDTEVRKDDFGVYKFWPEVSEGRPAFNFLHSHGLGVLFWGPEIPEGLKDFAENVGNEKFVADTRARFFRFYWPLKIKKRLARWKRAITSSPI